MLTVNDFISTIGKMLAAIKLNLLQHPSGFRETHSIKEAGMLLAEKYLCVWNGARGTTSAETFDELHMEIHMKATIASLDKLPTSSVIKRHPKQWFAVISGL